MNTIIMYVPHSTQLYDTAGDYRELGNGWMELRISNLENPDYEHALTVHELLEDYSRRKRGISTAEIDEWDFAHINHPDPGSIPGCPYFVDHKWATEIEKLIIAHYGHEWPAYDESFEKLQWRTK
jgi:hypothetical protein